MVIRPLASCQTLLRAQQIRTFVASSLAQTVCIQQTGMSDAKSAHALLYSFRTGLSSGQRQQHTGAVNIRRGRTGSTNNVEPAVQAYIGP
jgi:hypothetical protein|eukprot:COSAG03_NODE_239_length_10132_cov_30.644772_7_plen_90_part_00